MKMNNLPDIPEKYFDPDYVITISDIAATLPCKEGLCSNDDEKMLKSILYLYGMDINRDITETLLDGNASIRSNVTGLIQKGGTIYQGYERRDDSWKKLGLKITESYLFGGKFNEFVKVVKGE